ncbi:MAG TPA: DUF1707 domain-containing protein [Pseudonocardiaceae bacterium]|nr:DUF1707 domain-containing protein [Pseudonocardiaceae bacterium]
MTVEPTPPPLPAPQLAARNMRVSDAEREHVVGLLQKAVALGLLNLDEFTERTDIALAAKIRAELNSVLLDLPGLGQIPGHVPGQVAVAVPGVKPLELRTRTGNIKQTGQWTVPSSVLAECTMGNVTVDFTEARVSTREIEMRIQCGSGNITVIVPHGWNVVMEQVTTGMGNVVNRATEPADPTMPVLRVSAKVGMGNAKIRYPRGNRR